MGVCGAGNRHPDQLRTSLMVVNLRDQWHVVGRKGVGLGEDVGWQAQHGELPLPSRLTDSQRGFRLSPRREGRHPRARCPRPNRTKAASTVVAS